MHAQNKGQPTGCPLSERVLFDPAIYRVEAKTDRVEFFAENSLAFYHRNICQPAVIEDYLERFPGSFVYLDGLDEHPVAEVGAVLPASYNLLGARMVSPDFFRERIVRGALRENVSFAVLHSLDADPALFSQSGVGVALVPIEPFDVQSPGRVFEEVQVALIDVAADEGDQETRIRGTDPGNILAFFFDDHFAVLAFLWGSAKRA